MTALHSEAGQTLGISGTLRRRARACDVHLRRTLKALRLVETYYRANYMYYRSQYTPLAQLYKLRGRMRRLVRLRTRLLQELDARDAGGAAAPCGAVEHTALSDGGGLGSSSVAAEHAVPRLRSPLRSRSASAVVAQADRLARQQAVQVAAREIMN